MWKVKFCAVVFLLLVFVPDADCFWRRRRRRRYTPPCSMRDCQVSSWSEWSPCTHQCGTSGKQKRTRTVTVVASCGGSCPFVLAQTHSCNRVPCQNSGTPTAVTTTSALPRRSSSAVNVRTTPLPVTSQPHFTVSVTSTIASTPISSGLAVTSVSTIEVTAQPPFIVPVASTIAPTPLSSGLVVTSTSTIQVTTQPPFTACGGTLSGSSGSFASPGYPGFYSNNLNCLWTLFIPANGFLRLQFIVFETEPFFDFVVLTDIFGQRIDRLNGSRSGLTITITGERTTLLRIRFITDSSDTRQGFKAQYSMTFDPISSFVPAPSSSAVIATPTPTMQVTARLHYSGDCGENLAGTSGYLTSPNWPLRSFPPNSFCASTITVPAGLIIKFTVRTYLLLPNEHTDCTGSLRGARVFITNVASHDGAQQFMIKLCGQRPNPVYSVGNSIQVRLLSLNNVSLLLRAFYEAIPADDLCPVMAQLNETSGVITSPFYPRRYPNNQDCTWQITANKGNRVKLEIEDTLDIFECGFQRCLCDYLEVRSGYSSDGGPGGRTCGRPRRILTFYSILETLTVRFFSDNLHEMQSVGFKATYTHLNFTPPVCPNEPIPLSGNGRLSSPNYPVDRYPPSSTCTWRITVSAGKRVKFAFIDFALGSCALECSSETCTYVEVYDGASASSPLLARFCHNSAEEEKISSGNQMFVKFSAGFSLDRGFEAQYSETMDPPSPTITSNSSLTTAQPTTIEPYVSSLPPFSIAPTVTVTTDIQRALVDLLRSLVEIIQRLQALVGGSFSPAEFEDFRNQTLQILQQAENQLVNPSSSRLVKREIPELSSPQDLVQMIENIQRRLLG